MPGNTALHALRKLIQGATEKGGGRRATQLAGDLTPTRAPSVEEGYFDLIGAAPQGPLTLYHGSPHTFAPTDDSPLGRFMISEKLRTGEGAIAYGPGAYLTGDRGLAREYAKNLAARKGGGHQKLKTSVFSPETAWGDAIKEDPAAFLEYLRLRAALGARDMGDQLYVTDRRYDVFGQSRRRDVTQLNQLRTPGVEMYLQRAAEAGVDLDALPRRLGRTSGPGHRSAMDAGDRLRNAFSENPLVVEPTIRTQMLTRRPGLSAFNLTAEERLGMIEELRNKGIIGPGPVTVGGRYPPRVLVERNRLNATNAAIAGRPGPNYRYSMDGVVDLSKLAAGEPKSAFRPNLYVAETPAKPGSDLFSYDYPLWTNAPNLVDRLERIAAPLELPRFNVDRSGQDMIHKMTQKVGPLNTIKAFKDHEVPGMYYLKGGSRGYYATKDLPTQFVPNDYNFLFFDPDALKIIDRKARGGLA